MKSQSFIAPGSFWAKFLGDDVRLPAMVLSFVLSLWVSFTGDVVNLDGILYLNVADLLQDGNFAEAGQIYHWYFYPLLIAAISKVLFVPLDTAAYLLTALLSALLSYAFVSCVRILGADRKVLLLAAFVIVSQPMFMETRTEVIRDHGYWAFYLLSVYHFLKFYRSPTWLSALFWAINMVIATLFRIEGVLFLFVVPFVVFVRHGWQIKEKLMRFWQASFVNVLFLLVGGVAKLVDSGINLLDQGRLGEPLRFFNKFYVAMSGGLDQKMAIIEKNLLNSRSDEYALAAVLAIPVIIFLDKLLGTLTPIYAILLSWHPLKRARTFNMDFLPVLIWFICLNSGMHFFVLLGKFSMAKRHIFPLGLIILLLLPFILSFYYEKWKNLEKKSFRTVWPYVLMLIIIAVNFLDGTISLSGQSSRYIKDAGSWLSENIPADARLYSNNPKIYYYSDHLPNYRRHRAFRIKLKKEWMLKKKENHRWEHYDYVALWASRKNPIANDDVSSILGSQPIKIFRNARNDRVLIYAQKAKHLSEQK